MTEIIELVYNNVKEYGGFLFVGVCILVGAYWIRSANDAEL